MAKKLIIGIQGDRGSTNERAARLFSEKHGWPDYEIKYLISTENVLRALNTGEIDYGTFARESRSGLVAETEAAIKKYAYEKIDEEKLQLDHALLASGGIDKSKTVEVHSHPQALLEHGEFLKKEFSELKLIKEADTGGAAKDLSEGKYPKNSLVIASIVCAEMYGLNVYQKDLPGNIGYWVKIYLAGKKDSCF
ncbi:MAG: prephenate dehydratase domain-containing protein [Patescibacteria group bacterium]|jgi:prephenate dehydratase